MDDNHNGNLRNLKDFSIDRNFYCYVNLMFINDFHIHIISEYEMQH
jgi:hypothetical protein